MDPLHGIPWGGKDLLDTAGIPTTYGAEPFRDRVPSKNAVVVDRLNAAGAVLVAKLSLGALALNDIWFGGQTVNPWLLEEGSSGSSAGPGAATAAGTSRLCHRQRDWRQHRLAEHALWHHRIASDLRPRAAHRRDDPVLVTRQAWSDDAPRRRCCSGLCTRSRVQIQAISTACPANSTTIRTSPVKGLRVGYFPAWMKEDPATDVDRAALATISKVGMVPVEVSLPNWPYDSLDLILFAEAAASFEELTLSHKIDQLKVQVPDAWPNTFRQSRFLSAVDFVQTDRFRRKVAKEMARIFSQVDLLLVPSLRDEMLTITNFTGHPSLTLRAGFVEVSEARSDWAPDPAHPLPKFSPPRRVPHGDHSHRRTVRRGHARPSWSCAGEKFRRRQRAASRILGRPITAWRTGNRTPFHSVIPIGAPGGASSNGVGFSTCPGSCSNFRICATAYSMCAFCCGSVTSGSLLAQASSAIR